MQNIQHIRLQFDPYAFARIVTMKSLLLKKEDYDRLLKMTLPEIAKYLQDRGYKQQIDAQPLATPIALLLEKAIMENLAESFQKIKRISEENIAHLVNAYMMRYDIANCKTIIRAKMINTQSTKIEALLYDCGRHEKKKYLQLLTLQKPEDVINNLPIVSKEQKKMLIKLSHEIKSPFAMENLLDKYYTKYLLAIAEQIPKEGKLFRTFINNEIDTLNIKLLIRSKKESLPFDQVKSFTIPFGEIMKRINLQKLYPLELDKLIESLATTTRWRLFKQYKRLPEEKKTVVQLENMINKHLLEKAELLIHQNPLSIYIVLGYMLSKDIEVRNLNMIIKAKQLDVEESFVEEQLIIG